MDNLLITAENKMDIAQITEYGAVGLAAGLIVLIYCILRWVFKILGNHVNHSTDAIKGLTAVMSEVKGMLSKRNGDK